MKRAVKFFGIALGILTMFVGADAMAKTAQEWINSSGGRGHIYSVQWAADVKSEYPSSNVCALWMGPVGDSVSTTVKVDQNYVDSNGNYNVGVYGMCTDNNGVYNTAQYINICSDEKCVKDEYDGLFPELPESVYRGGWGSPGSGSTATININKFKELATKTVNGETTKYVASFPVRRCHYGYSPSSPGENRCSTDTVTLEMEIKESVMGQSNVSIDGSYATTGLVTKENKTKTANKSASSKVGDTKQVVFSHNVFSDSEIKDRTVTWRVEAEQWNAPVSPSPSGGNRTVNSWVKEGQYYVPSERGGSDGTYNYLYRNVFNVPLQQENATYKMCESLYVDGEKYTTVCATITVGKDVVDGECGAWAPASYLSSNAYTGTTSVVVKVLNPRLNSTYSDWRGVVDEGTSPGRYVSIEDRITFARPGDSVQWLNCYYPGVQTVSETDRSAYHGAEGMYIDGTVNGNRAAWTYGWQNQYSITSESSASFGGARPASRILARGDSSTQEAGNTYRILTTDVGDYFQETIRGGYSPVYVSMTNEGLHAWSCFPYTCCNCWTEDGCCGYTTCYRTCRHAENYIRTNAWISGPVVSGAARVEVPYNYVNTTGVTMSLVSPNDKNAVYAGETARIENSWVRVGTRDNSVVEDDYATIVDNGQVSMITYVTTASNASRGDRTVSGNSGSDVCGLISEDKQCATVKEVRSTTLNESGNLSGTTYTNNIKGTQFNGVYDVFDASAGDYFCVALAVYPANSGILGDTSYRGDKNLDPNGDGNWYISAPSCKVIAKKPSVQVLGGSMYTAGDVTTTGSISAKRNFYGYTAYSKQYGAPVYFGSMVELSIVSQGVVTNLATGMAVGGSNTAISYGSNNNDYCGRWAALGVANYAGSYVSGICPGPNAVGLSKIQPETVNRQALADYFIDGGAEAGSRTVSLNSAGTSVASATGRDIRYVYNDGDVTITNSNLYANQTRIVKAENVTIDGNIWYNGTYSNSSQVPKVVIYADENIDISCYVGNVDAILIAGGRVNTCYEATGTDVDSSIRSQSQLRINGAVIANRIQMLRTYGNATGRETSYPAELVNYDTSALLWGRSMADAGESDTLTVTYQHELAPRY